MCYVPQVPIFHMFSINLAANSTPVSRLAFHLQHIPFIKLHTFQTSLKWKQTNKQTVFFKICFVFMGCARKTIPEKKCMFSPSYEPFRKQKHNHLFIKPEENFLWNLRVSMCCSAVKCKNNYVRDLRLAKQVFFLVYLCAWVRRRELLYMGFLGYLWYKTNYVKVKSIMCFHAHGIRATKPRKQCGPDPRIYLGEYSWLWCLNSLNTQSSEGFYIYIVLKISDFLDTIISHHWCCSHTLLEQEKNNFVLSTFIKEVRISPSILSNLET